MTIYYETPEHVLCDASDPGATPFTRGGLQPDGSYLYKIDLDRHKPGQDPDGMLDYIKLRCGPELWARLRPRRSLHGGWHTPFRTTRPLNECKLYDARVPSLHIGELCAQRIERTDHEAPLLNTLETIDLFRAFHAPGARPSGDASAAPAPTRNDRKREGEALIDGWGTIRGWQARLDTLCEARPMLATYRALLRAAPLHGRSNAYANFVQSLMLHAAGLGSTIQERCRWVAAMAIGTGAAGKEQDRDYRIARDTAVMVAKIIHGDPMEARADGTVPHWQTPRWVNGQQLPPAPAPEPAKRPAHRPVSDRARAVKRLEKMIRRWLDDAPSGRIYYYVADLADDMSCSPRSVSNYLADLEDAGKIKRDQVKGRGGRAYFDVLPAFWHANNSEKPAETDTKPDTSWHASPMPTDSIPAPETDEKAMQCNKVIGAPKPYAPAVRPGLAPAPLARPDDWEGVEERIAEWEQTPEGRRAARWDARQTVDPVIFARVDPIARGVLPAGYLIRPPGRVGRWRLIDPSGQISWHATEPRARSAAYAARVQGFGAPPAETTPEPLPAGGSQKGGP